MMQYMLLQLIYYSMLDIPEHSHNIKISFFNVEIE